MENIIECPICKSIDLVEYKKVVDYTVSKEVFNIVNCESCNFKFTNPRPKESEIGKYYKAESYISHTNTSKGVIAKLYHLVRKYTLRGKVQLINSLQPNKGKLLDIGCGTGMFINSAKEDGWKVFGIEPDEDARKIAEDINGIKVQSEILPSYSKEQFEVITMWHVLEHIHKINETVEWLNQKLKVNGNLIIAVPNHLSKDAEIYQEQWAAYDVPRHLYHFSQETITHLMGNHQFELVQTLPMKFDSFYVSMLSTKYQSGKINYVKAFWDGLKSNSVARDRQGNYSSLIYVFKKK